MRRFLAGSALAAAGVAFLPMAGVVLSVGAAPPGESVGTATAPASLASIPGDYLADIERAAARFDVPWAVIAGIYAEECDFGRSRLAGCNPPGTENSAGAQGPGQFLPTTWRRGLAPHQLIPLGPPTRDDAEGYATDGDGDGIADPWDPADAIAATARLLAANGAASGDVTGAVFAYNHDPLYVEAVLAHAATYERAADGAAGGSSGDAGAAPDPGSSGGAGSGPASSRQSAIAAILAFAEEQLGKPYRWGGSGPDSWDCSGLVQAAFAQVGVDFTHDAAAQYAATSAEAVSPTANLQPGDLVFFGPSIAGIEHVGIVIGRGEMIDAPHTGAVVRIESYDWPDLVAATRPL